MLLFRAGLDSLSKIFFPFEFSLSFLFLLVCFRVLELTWFLSFWEIRMKHIEKMKTVFYVFKNWAFWRDVPKTSFWKQCTNHDLMSALYFSEK